MNYDSDFAKFKENRNRNLKMDKFFFIKKTFSFFQIQKKK